MLLSVRDSKPALGDFFFFVWHSVTKLGLHIHMSEDSPHYSACEFGTSVVAMVRWGSALSITKHGSNSIGLHMIDKPLFLEGIQECQMKYHHYPWGLLNADSMSNVCCSRLDGLFPHIKISQHRCVTMFLLSVHGITLAFSPLLLDLAVSNSSGLK